MVWLISIKDDKFLQGMLVSLSNKLQREICLLAVTQNILDLGRPSPAVNHVTYGYLPLKSWGLAYKEMQRK